MNVSSAIFLCGSDESQLFVNSRIWKLQKIGDGKRPVPSAGVSP